MHPFAESFGQAVGQQLREDGVVVVALRAELFGQLLEPYAAREGEGPDIVGSACLFVGDESARQRAWASRTGAWLRSIGRMYFLSFGPVTTMSSPRLTASKMPATPEG